MNIKNKKNLYIILAIVVVVLIVICILIKKNTDKNGSVLSTGDSTSISETVNNYTESVQTETVTDENGQVITQVSTDSLDNNSDSSHRSKDSSDEKTSKKSSGGGVNEMDDIFTDEAIENTTTKKNSQNTTDKNGDSAETKPANDDGWSDFY